MEYEVVSGEIDQPISKVTCDVTDVIEGAVFVCNPRKKEEAYDLMTEALLNGAVAIVTEQTMFLSYEVTLIVVKDVKRAMACLAAEYYNNPANKLITIGVTGTNGKTITANLVYEVLRQSGYACGLIGSEAELPISDTEFSVDVMSDSIQFQESLKKMVQAGCNIAVIEIPSLALKRGTVVNVYFDYGIVTNIFPNHIGEQEHSTYEEYRSCKAMLLKQCNIGILNADTKEFDYFMLKHTCQLETYGIHHTANVTASEISLIEQRTRLGIQFYVKGLINDEFKLFMPGVFNVYNCMAALMLLRHFGVNRQVVKEVIESFHLSGRVETVPLAKDYTVVLDYAENARTVSYVLQSMKDYHPVRMICLVGASESTMRMERYQLGEAAAMYSYLTVLTSSQFDKEASFELLHDMEIGVRRRQGRHISIPNRWEAIQYCMNMARINDMIVLTGYRKDKIFELSSALEKECVLCFEQEQAILKE